MKKTFIESGNIADLEAKRFFYGEVHVEDGRIKSIFEKGAERPGENYIIPGFTDSHVHIESSMIVPSEFAKLAVVHGTIATVSDPHEIANVCGIDGVNYMIDNGKTVPFKFCFGAPSCVPATHFETAGAVLNSDDVAALLQNENIGYLSEMMNFPGVLNRDAEVIKKIEAAKTNKKPVDGHAPGLRGNDAKKYIDAGISTDHECFTKDEALDKLKYGMKILIREGSAAKNFEALIGLLHEFPDSIMFCSDDKHPDSLVDGHINRLCARAVKKGIDIFKVLQAACVNPVLHYSLNNGLLQENDPADFLVIKNLSDFEVIKTFIDGELVAENGISLISSAKPPVINNFECQRINKSDLTVKYEGYGSLQVIEALDGQLITNKVFADPLVINGLIESDIKNDILKMVVINRYSKAPAAICFVKNFGLKKGAIASSVAHDSHNIIAVGTTDAEIAGAINLVIDHKGGISCVNGPVSEILPLPVAGLMSNEDGYSIAKKYTALDKMAKDCGSTLGAPFMTLSFMALLVIPHLKLSDLGLFDGDTFAFVS